MGVFRLNLGQNDMKPAFTAGKMTVANFFPGRLSGKQVRLASMMVLFVIITDCTSLAHASTGNS